MDALTHMPTWALALAIFGLRIIDVTLGTLRTISVVEGRVRLSVVLGFFEVLIWITAVSQVISGVNESFVTLVAYAAGFAAGNAIGIVVERRMAMGACVVRMISDQGMGPKIAQTLRDMGQPVTTFMGEGRNGPRMLVYATTKREDVPDLVAAATKIDPKVFYVVERVAESSKVRPLKGMEGWKGLLARSFPSTGRLARLMSPPPRPARHYGR